MAEAILDISDKGFKTTILNMLKELKENKELKEIRKTQYVNKM